MNDSTDALLNERGKTHGDYREHALVTQALKEILRAGPRWNDLTNSQKETLDMIAHKMGRVVSGDPNFKDHWNDIQGYARLVSNQL